MSSNGYFTSDEHAAFERLSSFHRNRLELVKHAARPSDNIAGVLVVHLLPQSSFGRAQFAGSVLRRHGTAVGTAWCGSSVSYYGRFNADGWLMPESKEASRSYSLLFRDGRLEAVLHDVCYTDNQTKIVRASRCEEAILRIVPAYLEFCKAIGIQGPIWLFSSLIGLHEARFRTNPDWNDFGDYKIESATTPLPETVIDPCETDHSQLLRRWCDGFWQAGGIDQSLNYESDGIRRPRSRL